MKGTTSLTLVIPLVIVYHRMEKIQHQIQILTYLFLQI